MPAGERKVGPRYILNCPAPSPRCTSPPYIEFRVEFALKKETVVVFRWVVNAGQELFFRDEVVFLVLSQNRKRVRHVVACVRFFALRMQRRTCISEW